MLGYIKDGGYKSWDEYYTHPHIKTYVDQLVSGFFDNTGEEFRLIYDSLLIYKDEFFVLKDLNSYLETYERLQAFYPDRENWNRTSLVNIAESGIFSSDCTIREYADRIWKIRI